MSEPVYKVSYVVADIKHPGAIINSDHRIEVGDEVTFDGQRFVVTEVEELMPPVGGFGLLHATVRSLESVGSQK